MNIQPLPINGYLDKFTTTALGGAAPDVVDLDTTWVSTVAAHGLLQPLDDLVAKLPVADISPAAWKASQFKGVQYAIPNRSGPGVYYYNKTVFDKAGVPYPTDDWTYSDFLEIAKKLTIPGQQYGVGVPADVSDPSNVTTMFAPMLWAMGGDFLIGRWHEAADQQPRERQGHHLLVRPLPEIQGDAGRHAELHHDARHPASLRGKQGRAC